MQDWQLLREYVEHDSQAAFSELVKRYLNLVYSTCLREVGDVTLAEDTTQVVFLLLSQKAHTLSRETVLAGWLFQTARFAALNARRQEKMRQQRLEQVAEALRSQAKGETVSAHAAMETDEALWAQVEEVLHEAMGKLSDADRNAVLLRCFEDRSLRETGQALGISEDAARKRVARALEKLRRYFTHRGVTLSTAVLTALLSTHAVQAAPASLATAINTLIPAASGVVAAGAGGAAAGAGSSLNVLNPAVLTLAETTKRAWFINSLIGSLKAGGTLVCAVVVVVAGARQLAPGATASVTPTLSVSAPLPARPRMALATSYSRQRPAQRAERLNPVKLVSAISPVESSLKNQGVAFPVRLLKSSARPESLRRLPEREPEQRSERKPARMSSHKAQKPVIFRPAKAVRLTAVPLQKPLSDLSERNPKMQLKKSAVAAIIGVTITGLSAEQPPVLAQPPGPPPKVPRKNRLSVSVPLALKDPALAGVPLAPGWPLALPGSVTGTPVLADLDGDKKWEIIVPSMHRTLFPNVTMAHPAPDVCALLYAFHQDGKTVKGWPAVLLDEGDRATIRKEHKDSSELWFSSPSVTDAEGDGKDEIVLTIPGGGVRLVRGDATVIDLSQGTNGDAWATVPVIDLDGNRVPDAVAGWLLTSVAGGPVPGWPKERIFQGGFAPCIGDADHDGLPEIYHPFYGGAKDDKVIGGFDNTGQVLPGWPQKASSGLFYPVMGDVAGDENLEIIGIDNGQQIRIWAFDGGTVVKPRPGDAVTSVAVNGVNASLAPPALADLDGDGKDEIIVYDNTKRAVRAWRGDGSELKGPNGPVAAVPVPPGAPGVGVTVADLGNDGEMDIFVGTFWIRRAGDGTVSINNMLPQTALTTTEVTLADVDQDGLCEAIFGLVDGRLFVYKTGKAYDPLKMFWPTRSGNFRHTGSRLPPENPA